MHAELKPLPERVAELEKAGMKLVEIERKLADEGYKNRLGKPINIYTWRQKTSAKTYTKKKPEMLTIESAAPPASNSKLMVVIGDAQTVGAMIRDFLA